MTSNTLPFRLVADENLALADYFFADLAQIDSLAGRAMTAQDVHTADALMVRSVTRVDAALLAGSAVRFVGSATIGTDHVDQAYLQQQQIGFANAAGCNAQAVAEYVVTAILHLRPQLVDAGQDFCLGIVGLGNVGRRLAALAQRLRWRVVGYDPFVQLQQIDNVDFEQLLQHADAVSIHVPLSKTGQHPTYHLFDQQALCQMKKDALLINSARGEVVSEAALLQDLAHTQRQVVLDVFEHEPNISQTLLSQLALATPHIAGYSLEGKARGTAMVYQAFCQYMGFIADKNMDSQLASMPSLFDSAQPLSQQLLAVITDIYPITRDDQALRACVNEQGWVDAATFDQLRKQYPLRREWAAYGDVDAVV